MRRTTLVLMTIAAMLSASRVHAKRMPPKPVAPVVANGIRYDVPHFWLDHAKDAGKTIDSGAQNGGFVRARNIKNRRVLWYRMVYRVQYTKNLEGDVQDVFITKLRIKGDKLLVTNEESEEFEMDLPTGKVRALTAVGPGREVPIDPTIR